MIAGLVRSQNQHTSRRIILMDNPRINHPDRVRRRALAVRLKRSKGITRRFRK
jgi:hypothetical protein